MPPVVHPATQELYDGLPRFYRVADAQQAGDLPLLRYLSLMGDQLGEVLDLLDRVNYVAPDEDGELGDTSDLVDPATADAAWLPWLAQLVGARITPAMDETARRDAIAGASTGWRAATASAIALAAATALTGSRYLRVINHYTGDRWKIELMTRATETPDAAAVAQAVIDAHAKPVGVELVPVAYTASWATLEAERPTWADWAAAGSWALLEETGAV